MRYIITSGVVQVSEGTNHVSVLRVVGAQHKLVDLPLQVEVQTH